MGKYLEMAEYYSKHAEMGDVMGDIIAITVGAILIASMLPTALDSVYGVNTGWFVYGGSSTGVNDSATVAIFNLLPLFAVLGGLALMLAPVVRRLA